VRAKNRKHVCTPTADRTRPHEWRLNEHGNYTWSLVKQPAAPGSSGIKRHRDSELDELASDESSGGPPENAPDSAASAAKKPRTSLERLVDSLSLRKMGVVRREDGALVLKCPNSCCTQQVASSSALCCRSSSGWGNSSPRRTTFPRTVLGARFGSTGARKCSLRSRSCCRTAMCSWVRCCCVAVTGSRRALCCCLAGAAHDSEPDPEAEGKESTEVEMAIAPSFGSSVTAPPRADACLYKYWLCCS